VTAYSLDGNVEGATTLFTVLLCLAFNGINVVMEEGVFRGLFTKLGMRRLSFMASNTIASILFGLWHIALPVRGLIDGDMSPLGAFASSSLYVLTSTLMGFQLGLLARMTGGLWAAMGIHFVNNTIINLLHITTLEGADELQTMRMTIFGMVSFIVILAAYLIWYRKKKKAAAGV
jgi:membrane protease YdiL (CAAX protease family)